MTPEQYLIIPFFSILNRARGTKLFGLTNSTTIGRLVATFGMAMAVALSDVPNALYTLPVAWLTLFLWTLPAWDAYWSAEIGNDPLHSKFWGLWHMALRMILAAPCILGLAYIEHGSYYWALGTPLLALPYLVFGLFKTQYTVPCSEYTVGAMLGFLIMKAINL